MKNKKVLIAAVTVVVVAVVGVLAWVFSGYQAKVQGDIAGEYIECVSNNETEMPRTPVENGVTVTLEKKDDETYVVSSADERFNGLELQYIKFGYRGVANGRIPDQAWNFFKTAEAKIGYSTYAGEEDNGENVVLLYLAPIEGTSDGSSMTFIKK